MNAVEKFLSPNMITVPKKLLDAVVNEGWRIEKEEAVLLIWKLIQAWNAAKEEEFSYVADTEFQKITTRRQTLLNAKQWLLENSFLSRVMDENGYAARKIPAKGKAGTCEQWQAHLTEAEQVTVALETKDCLCIYEAATPTEEICKYSADVQKQLIYKQTELQTYLNEIEANTNEYKRVRVQNSARALHHKVVNAKRGQRVNRLFSTFTLAPRLTRRCFTLDSQEIVTIDLQAGQPTLLAAYAGDEALLQRCYDNLLYDDVQEITGAKDRDMAKIYWNRYCLGRNYVESWKKDTLQIQKYVQNQFPVAFNYIWKAKMYGHKYLSHKLQNEEARLFVDVILQKLKTRDLAALTIHDSIACKETDKNLVLEIMQETLDREIPNQKYKLKLEELKTGVMQGYKNEIGEDYVSNNFTCN
tara:strand:- start:246 stop:1490 length:1245 start_codon:yes stop_codon:yes gene_type:complete